VGYAPYALPGSEQLGENIAATFAKGYNVVLLESHGVATGGADLLTAFQRLETLDFCARTLLKAQGLGQVRKLTDDQVAYVDHGDNLLPEFKPARHPSRERELRQQIVEIVHRAYDRYLMISTEGVVSARIDERAFLITPTGLDRRSLEIQDIVLIQDGKREQGKLPSRSVLLHQAIYRQHPGIGCVMTAQSPNVTAYAVASREFGTKTIPESYVLLRDIPMVPFGAQYQEPQQIAEALSQNTPVLLIQNDCVLITGSTVLKAFDRLEVAEFTARSLIDTASIGELVPIGTSEVNELERKYLGV
jgi:L-fuculose-phosphate aldolase